MVISREGFPALSIFVMRGDVVFSGWGDFERDLIKEIENDFKSGSKETKEFLGSMLTNGDIEKLANQLKDYIRKYMQHYFDNYDAVSRNGYDWKYKGQFYHYEGRTGQLLDSILVDIDSASDGLSARVYFDESKIYRKSLFGQGDGNVLNLLNDGYKTSSGWHKNIHHFGYFEGARFLEAAIIEARKNPVFEGVDIVYEPTGNYGMGF